MKGRLGPKSINWNPDITDEDRTTKRNYPEYKEWRQAVYEKNDFTCRKCGEKSGNLNAHHIESYDVNKDLRTTLKNGVTLCRVDHDKFHHRYGLGNNTREQFEEFIDAELDK